jgi:predicted ABC-type ATPase
MTTRYKISPPLIFMPLRINSNLKKIIIIAGPNGAGKTTFARNFLPIEANTLHFINADLIAAGLSPFQPETASIKAGRLMLQEIEHCANMNLNFALETTLSGLSYIQRIKHWKNQGYHVKLWFLSLPCEDIAISRVSQRVKQCGHNIPEEVIRRRFQHGLANFENHYKPIVSSWAFYNNYGLHPQLIDWSGL